VFDKIVLGVDGSDEAKKAVSVAIDLARKSQGEVLVVHVHQKELTSRETDDVEPRYEAEMLTDATLDVVRKAGVRARSELRVTGYTGVAKEILDAAEHFGADAIVLGSRGLGDWSGLLLGSVTHKVIQHARCPVLVVRD
jgi:nucleotide-binding universal stress UspA family protein